MTYREFISKFSNITTADGPRASYQSIHVRQRVIRFTRVSNGNQEEVLISELYNLYNKEEKIDTVVARKHISGRVYSPSVAILKATGLYSNNGDRLGFIESRGSSNVEPGGRITHIISSSRPKTSKADTNKVKDETIFFKALSSFLGPNRLYSKSIDYPITYSDVYLSDDYSKYRFKTDNTNIALQEILKSLDGTDNFNNKSLSHHVDGLIYNHTLLGNRIVEFDEEQHFTPARKDSLLILRESMDIPYANRFIAICDDLDYLNNKVLKKNHIKSKLDSIPNNFISFIDWLNGGEVSESNYTAPKPAFNYLGGRIAQRAYYDCLRDIAHLSEFNKTHKLQPPLRFAKYTFEEKFKKRFAELSKGEIIDGVKDILKQDFNY